MARLIAAFLGLCFGEVSCSRYLLSAPTSSDNEAQVSRQLTAEEKTNINVYEASNRSVVNINTKATVTTGFFLMESPSEGAGSGIVIDKQGHVLTNFHVVDLESSPKVIMTDYTFETGEVIMADKDADLAIIKVKRDIPVLKLAQNGKLHPPDTLIAIGYPLGGDLPGESSIVKGAFSRIIKDKEADISYIQTDIALVSGMSGGPMINVYGEVVGINTAGLVPEGMGIAVSSDSIIERYKAMEMSENPLKDIKPMVFMPEHSPLEAVRAFYNYLKIRKLEEAYALLSDNFLRGGSFEKWSIGYRPLLDTTVILVRKDKKVKDRIKVKLSTKDLVGDEIVYKYFEGYWNVRNIDGKWMLWKPRIRRVMPRDKDWFYDQDFLEEYHEFQKTHEDIKKYAALMYDLSQEPGNGELSMQELYDMAKEIIDGQK